MAIATLSIDLVAKLAELQSGMDKAGRIAEKNAAQIEARYQRMTALATSVGAALGGAISIAGITTFLRATIDGVDKLNDLSDATGASIENLSALEDIAARTGTSMDTVGDAVVKLNKSLASATPGSDIEASFKALGLSVTELKSLDPAEALRRVSVALAGYADNGNKARLVQELFGKSVKEVAPLLKDLAAAGQFNATVTTEQAKEAEKFNQQLSALGKNSIDAARVIAGPLVTALNAFFEGLDKAKSNKGGFWQGIGESIKLDTLRSELETTTAALQRNFEQYQRDTARLNSDTGEKLTLTDAIAKTFAQRRVDEYRSMQAAAEKYRGEIRSITGLPDPGAGRGNVNPPLASSLPSLPGGPIRSEAPRVLAPAALSEATRDALAAIKATDANKILEISAALDELFAMRAGGLGGGPDIDEAIQSLRDSLAKLTPEGRAAAEAMERMKAILSQTPTGLLKSVLADIELINRKFNNGADDAEQWAQAIRVVTARLGGDVKQPLEQISAFAEQASRNIQDAMGETIERTLEGNFKNIGQLWANLLKRMVSQAIAANVGEYLFGDSAAKGTGGTLGPILAGLFAGARASGGPVQAGRPYLVGERGPELMVPSSNGTIVPNGAMGGGVSIHQTLHIGQGVSRAEVYAAVMQANAQAEARMRRLQREGVFS